MGVLGKEREVTTVVRVAGVQVPGAASGGRGAARRERAPLAIGEAEQEAARAPIRAAGIT